MSDRAKVPAEALLVAIAHRAAGRIDDATRLCREMLRRDPGQPHALTLHGQCLLDAGDAKAAASWLARAAATRPDHADTALALGNARHAAGDTAGALDAWRGLLARTPDHAGAGLNVARVLCARGDHAAAVRAANAVLAAYPASVEAQFLRGTALSALGDHAAAVTALRAAVAGRPDHAHALLNLGNALAEQDRQDEALACIAAAIAADPVLVEAHASLGHALMERGRLDEAIAACDVAIRLRPGSSRAHWNRGIACLLAGDWAAGWEGYEWRRRDPTTRDAMPRLPGRVWDGEPMAGRIVMVAAEQGLGDTIQCTRYLPMIAARNARVTLACDRRLIGLMRRIDCVERVVDRTEPLPAYDAWIDQLSLPRLFATRPDDVPPPALFNSAMAMRPTARRRVGIVWAGNPLHSNDRRRSLPAAHLQRLREADVGWISMQVGPQSGEAARLGTADRSDRLTDMAATADLIAGLDLVITIDSAVAHLAGSLGCPTWVMLPHAPDWRWMLGHDTTPWYPTMRLFRQTTPGDWHGVIGRVLAELSAPPAPFA